MNKRIEELAKQAGFSKGKYQLYLDENSNTEGVDLEKFAELIVQECITVSTDHQCFPKDHLTLEEAFISGQEHTVRCIKQHFGVEE